jgi:hypothetical protein
MNRKNLKTWRASLFTFAIALSMVASVVILPTVFAKIGVNLDQFQNGHPPPTGAQWANGSINSSNSAYHEGESIPFRYFVTGLKGGTTHFFTIQWDYKKGGKPAYDYVTSFDRAPNGAYITSIGGPCSTTATAVPSDCVSPTPVATFPNPGIGETYGYLPFTTNVGDADRQLKAYNAGLVTFSNIYVQTGTASDPSLNITVTFTAAADGSAGFFWGGHLARGVASDWGVGNGASSVSGAPFHMRTQNFDNAGATNQDRSVQPGAVLPEAGCGITPADAVCDGVTTTYSGSGVASGATYSWAISGNGYFVDSSGGTLPSPQTTTTVKVKASGAGSYTLTLTTGGSGFEPQTCTTGITVNANPVVSITPDTSVCATPSLTATGAAATGDTINWTGPGIPTGTEHNATIYPTAAGTYTVQIFRNGCASNIASGNLCFTFTSN